MSFISKSAIAVIASSFTLTTAGAEDTAQPAPPATTVEVPAMDCPQPKIPQRFSVAQEDRAYLYKKANEYADCVSAYVDARQADANKYNEFVRAHAEAGNAAVKEINEFRERVKAFDEKHDPKQKD